VVHALEAQRDALVRHALAVEPVGEADLAQQLDGGVFQHARPHPLLHVLAAAGLEHHGVDAGPGEEVRQQQTSRSRPDDPDLRAHATKPCARGPCPRLGFR
jgi:hypothetical protein